MAVPRSSHVRAEPHAAPARRFPPAAKDSALVSMRYAVEDYADEVTEYRRQLADAIVPLSDGHCRVLVKERCRDGQYEFCGLLDGFFIVFGDVDYSSPQSAYFASPDSLHIYLASSGDGEYVPSDGDPLSFAAPSTALIIEPAGRAPAEITLAGRMRYIYIILHRDVLRRLYAGTAHELPAILRAFLDGDLQQTSGHAVPLSAAMLRCLEDVHGCALEGTLRRLFLQSKALEIVCQALDAFAQSECFRSVESTRHTARSVLKAQLFLAQNFANPPSLEELGAEVGLSRSALCTGFRQLLGRSVYEYIRDLRMQQALALLRESDESIIQIAYAVGYHRPSSFAVAVQRHFGATPSELRRRAGSSPA